MVPSTYALESCTTIEENYVCHYKRLVFWSCHSFNKKINFKESDSSLITSVRQSHHNNNWLISLSTTNDKRLHYYYQNWSTKMKNTTDELATSINFWKCLLKMSQAQRWAIPPPVRSGDEKYPVSARLVSRPACLLCLVQVDCVDDFYNTIISLRLTRVKTWKLA